jgi:hypothetical protein
VPHPQRRGIADGFAPDERPNDARFLETRFREGDLLE